MLSNNNADVDKFGEVNDLTCKFYLMKEPYFYNLKFLSWYGFKAGVTAEIL